MNKNIVITGASSGIGRELAIKHLQSGNKVLAISRNEEKLKELEEYGKENFKYISFDLAERSDFQEISNKIKNWETIDVLYNNAGYLVNKPFSQITDEDLDFSWKVNFKAPFILIQSLLPKLKADSHIVNISTMGGIQGTVKFPGLSAYSSSKAALINLTELLSEEFKDMSIYVNCIALGAVQTQMLEKAFPGYKAQLKPKAVADFLYEFGLEGHKFQNGKTIQLSLSTP